MMNEGVAFKSKAICKRYHANVKRIAHITDAVDLYEQVRLPGRLQLLRERFSASGILPHIGSVIKVIALELDEIGLAVQSNGR